MKTLLSLGAVTLATMAAGQFHVNPQIGVNFTELTNEDEGIEYKADLGWQLGVDFRIGDRLYFQPGFYFVRTSTFVRIEPTDSLVMEDNLIRTSAKLKALLGYNIINGDQFKLRVNAGPTYDVLLSVDSKDDEIKFDEEDYNAGSFNMDAGLGVDLTIISVEAGVSYGLSKSYKDTDVLSSDSKYFTFYATAGIVLGASE
jgi:hypothetical protein